MAATTVHSKISKWQDDLLPHIVDRLARETPEATFGIWPVDLTSYEKGIYTISYAQLANIVNGLAWWIVKELQPGQSNPIFTYVGPNDVRITAIGIASVKAGCSIFLTSPRNSPAAHRSLFAAINCDTLVTTDPTPPAAITILETVKPRKFILPSVEELLTESYPAFPFDKSFKQGRWDPIFTIHTSGSTGLPKPMVWTQEAVARQQNIASREPPLLEGTTDTHILSVDRLLGGKRVMVTMPPFHGAGLGQYLFWGIPFGGIPIMPATSGIVNAHGLVEALKQTPCDVAILVPSVVIELAQNPELLDYCAGHLDTIFYMGGDLPQALGDRVAAKLRLRCWWGQSEAGMPQQLIPPELGPGDWRYIRMHPDTGIVFDPVGGDMYEMVVRRNDTLPQATFAIHDLENLQEHRTKDLFQPHPTVPDAWCWRGRTDDIIVFLNGEKTNPVSMEQHIVAKHPELAAALVVGTNRVQAALLIEPAASQTGSGPLTTAEQAALIERVWPSVQEANLVAPAHAYVEKALILVTPPDRPFLRAGKGTVQRAASVNLYADEIEALYANVETVADEEDGDGRVDGSKTPAPLDTTDAASVARFIRKTVGDITGWTDAELGPEGAVPDDDDVSFFDHGMDSLIALRLIRALRSGLHRPNLELSTVYQNPTISQLTAAILT